MIAGLGSAALAPLLRSTRAHARPADAVADYPAQPPACPDRWKGLLGRYGSETGPLVREQGGRLELLEGGGEPQPLAPTGGDRFRLGERTLAFTRGAGGTAAKVEIDGTPFPRRATGVEGTLFQITPEEPVAELRRRAMAASPPPEPGPFRPVDLVDIASLDPTIRLDIRYATDENFLGVPVYPAARAFLQRPAATSLLAAHRALAARGFGLLIHDAYRPWWVTWVFWEATPPDKREFVADPAKGSRHNRGCAVDLTLYRLDDGRAVEMPGVYDEMSERSYPGYPGGTTLERWHRDLLRVAMEAQGFSVFESEWWHFDFRGWRDYPILDIPFDRISP